MSSSAADPAGVQAKIMTVTPALAERLLARNTHNRRVTFSRVDQYAADMRNGDWQLNGEAIKISSTGQVLDGQHRLMAILEADVDVQVLLITGLPADTQETMDQGRNRSFGDVLKLRGESSCFALAAAVRYVATYEQHGVPVSTDFRRPMSVKELARSLDRNPEIRDSLKFALTLRRSWLPVSAVAALHYLFSTVSPEDAEDFFRKVCTGENLAATDAAYLLRERLIKEHHDASGLHLRVKIAFIVRAWNAYRQGESLRRLVWNPGGANPDRFPRIDGLHDQAGAAERAVACGVTKRGEQYAGWKQLAAGSGPSAERGRALIAKHGGEVKALKATHPDHGGSAEDFADVQAARA